MASHVTPEPKKRVTKAERMRRQAKLAEYARRGLSRDDLLALVREKEPDWHMSLGTLKRWLKAIADVQKAAVGKAHVTHVAEQLARFNSLYTMASEADPPDRREMRLVVESICKLLGLNAPQRMEHTGAEGGPIQHEYDYSKLSDAELDREYERVLEEAGRVTAAAASQSEGREAVAGEEA